MIFRHNCFRNIIIQGQVLTSEVLADRFICISSFIELLREEIERKYVTFFKNVIPVGGRKS